MMKTRLTLAAALLLFAAFLGSRIVHAQESLDSLFNDGVETEETALRDEPAPPAPASEPSTETPGEEPTARIVSSYAMMIKNGHLLAGSRIEISGPERWYHVHYQISLADGSLLRLDAKHDFLPKWGSIFTPREIETVSYDCRHEIPLEELSACENLPAGRTTLARIECLVWDPIDRKFVGSGRGIGAPVVITTNEFGEVTNVQTLKLTNHVE